MIGLLVANYKIIYIHSVEKTESIELMHLGEKNDGMDVRLVQNSNKG
jgi:hypothetical protein